MSDKRALWVKLLGLFDWVEVPDSSESYSSAWVPTSIVRVDIVIEEHLFEVMCPESPVLLEVNDEVGGNYLATTIAHESSSV